MGSGIYFPLSALLFSILLLFLLVFKKHIITVETKLYSLLVISNFFGLITELLCTFAAHIYDKNVFEADIILKSYLFFIIMWVYVFTIYIIYISLDKKNINNMYKIWLIILLVIIGIILFFLPIKLIVSDDFSVRYTEGMSVLFTYTISSILILLMIIFILRNVKKLKSKRYLPLLIFLTIGSGAMILQMLYPGLLLITYVETFITSLMYHTIENPDLKTIEELKKNRSLTSKSYIEKSNFLFRMSAEVRKPIDNIGKLNNYNLESDDIKEIKENSNLIDLNVRDASFTLNNILDVTSLDSKKINIVKNEKYSIVKLLNEIKLRELKKINNNIRYEFNISESIPEYLYGDSVRLKQVLTTIIDKSINDTKEGFIEINVNSINKYDVCRLIITIENSSEPLSLDEINNILSMDNEIDEEDINEIKINLKLVNKIINMMNGTLMIKSYNGNEFTIVIDSVIVEAKKEEIINETDILLVSNNEELLKKLENLFDQYTINTVLNGIDMIDLIRSGESYNLIIMDDEMKPISGLESLKKLKELDINIPCIVMLDEGKEKIKNHYIKDGFVDYILKNNLKEEVKRIRKEIL